MPTFFADLAADERPITLDCDVTIGFWPPRADLDLSPAGVARVLERGRIGGALVTASAGVWSDEARGVEDTLAAAELHGWSPCPAVNLRDARGIGERLDAWLERGVQAIRLPSCAQHIPTHSPGFQLTVREAASRGLLMLADGDFVEVQRAFRDLGAKVVFLDLSYYQGADFLIAAADEPTFVASTRRLLGPDSLEIICDEVGAHHVVFGSGSPLQDLEPTVWRLRDARLSATDFAAVAGGTLTSLQEQDS